MQPLSLPIRPSHLAGGRNGVMLSVPEAAVPRFTLKWTSQPHSVLSCLVATGGTLPSVQPFTGAVDSKENPRFEGVRELRAGLPHSGRLNMKDSIMVGPRFHPIDNNNCDRCH